MWAVYPFVIGFVFFSNASFSMPSEAPPHCLRLIGSFDGEEDDNSQLQRLLRRRSMPLEEKDLIQNNRDIRAVLQRQPSEATSQLSAYSDHYREQVRRSDIELDRLRNFISAYRTNGSEVPPMLQERLAVAEAHQTRVLLEWQEFQILTFVDPGW